MRARTLERQLDDPGPGSRRRAATRRLSPRETNHLAQAVEDGPSGFRRIGPRTNRKADRASRHHRRPPRPKSPHTTRPGVVAAIADWSARHRTIAIGGWLALTALAVLSGTLPLGEDAAARDPGEAGVAEALIDDEGGYAVRENVLIAGEGAYTADPEATAATADLVAALTAMPQAVNNIGSPLGEHGDAGSPPTATAPSSLSPSSAPTTPTKPTTTPYSTPSTESKATTPESKSCKRATRPSPAPSTPASRTTCAAPRPPRCR